jgi:hypothetical protein
MGLSFETFWHAPNHKKTIHKMKTLIDSQWLREMRNSARVRVRNRCRFVSCSMATSAITALLLAIATVSALAASGTPYTAIGYLTGVPYAGAWLTNTDGQVFCRGGLAGDSVFLGIIMGSLQAQRTGAL